ncbi:CRISPR-associated protein Cas4 [Cohnella thermotolerans]|uniref:CRISPR-associated protein Cas4 n=1 Tax=Cohnella thermotolerans TaxID=329858 RepID=UPI00040FCC64|nr:CRISPR-associated protein Cas4 [Cohnella thermotolerans]
MSGSAGFGRTGYEEDELLMISGMQHYAFCRRQWGLIHLEQQWAENVLTYEGRQLHRRADDPYFTELRGDVLVSRAMPLVSYRLGLYGVADVVEFHAVVDSAANKTRLAGRRGWWLPYPVEYKRGNRKPDDCDEVQLCAQAIALEEMLNVSVPEGALFYGERERRVTIRFDLGLRTRVQELAEQMHRDFASGVTASARYEPKCGSCSLLAVCKPKMKTKSAVKYLSDYLHGELD